ncbi:hypothetical protein ACTWQL_02435 [Pseudalkalibacillus sp. R45]|uniref:glycoside hydrolase family 38 N-terminal domain-containing protein n=1 Tax=Pseudalkalibacillus sp. R45 TaxID=3457433 RepID=UPI003FCE86F2
MTKPSFYYFFCNHWTQGGIGFAFPSGWYEGKKYERTFSSVYTIHKMLDAADDYPGLKVSMELDAYAYEQVEKEDPECITRLKEYIDSGKAAVDGGTYGQPFGQDYGWEPNIRQLTYGKKTIKEVLDYDIRAFLVEEQWFHPQMPQLLKKSGFEYASLQNQNSGQVRPLNESMILWSGVDGTDIPSIPANDLMVSCVRQYTGYKDYKDRLRDYDNPLLFQWVEIWPPGMDWGASADPFEKAIHHVKEWEGKSVTLQEYFDLEYPERNLEKIYISLDESNYKNNWYQGGGWGYDGDKVILWDQKAEQSLLAYETYSAFNRLKGSQVYPPVTYLQNLWKQLLILQNHDFSVARSYRAITKDGLTTEAGSYGVKKYQDLIEDCEKGIHAIYDTKEIESDITIANYNGVAGKQTIPFDIRVNGKEFSLVQKSEEIPFHIEKKENNRIQGLMVADIPALGEEQIQIKNQISRSRDTDSILSGEDWLEDENIRVSWKKGSWSIEILDKTTNQTVDFTAFTGPIGKQNEHDGASFHALSPAHEIFTFAFDGTTHCPDQLSISRIHARVHESNELKSTLKLHCDLLTLHTTDTPVAFAEAFVTVYHKTGKVDCKSYLYTGVYLSVQCEAVFSHSLANPKYYRNYPFGEEETHIDDIYTNSYLRINDGKYGFTLIHPGVQKVTLNRGPAGGDIKHLLARDRIFGEYEWTFSLYLGNHEPHESAQLSKQSRGSVLVKQTSTKPHGEFLDIGADQVLLSSFYKNDSGYTMRLINYSNDEVTQVKLRFQHLFSEVVLTDFNGNEMKTYESSHIGDETETILTYMGPWEIVTLFLKR